MSYSYQLEDSAGATQPVRNVSSVNAGVLTISGTWSAAQSNIGSLVTLVGTTASDGLYTVTQRISSSQFRLAPTPANSGAGGTATPFTRAATKTLSATAITSTTTSTIVVTGANFITNQIVRGDRLVVYNSASNDESYLISSVDSETQVTVVLASTLATTPLTAGGASGSIQVHHGYARINVIDEATPNFTALVAALSFFGTTEPMAIGWTLIRLYGIGRINVRQTTGATKSDWTSTKEVVLSMKAHSTAVLPIPFDFITDNSSSLTNTITIGTVGSDQKSVQESAVWYGFVPGDSAVNADVIDVQIYGSWISAQTPRIAIGGGEVVGSVSRHGVFEPGVFGVGDADLQSTVTVSDSFGAIGFGTPSSTENLLVAKSSPGFLLGATTRIEGLLLGADSTSPLFQLLSSNVEVLNPREDYAFSDLFQFFGNNTAIKSYTWDPTFIERETRLPIIGATIQLYAVNAGTGAEFFVGSITTDSNGKISGVTPDGRDGLNLAAVSRTPTIPETNWLYRVVVLQSGFAIYNTVFKLVRRTEVDITLDILRPPFEGEYVAGT
jgi:hypothetical protein